MQHKKITGIILHHHPHAEFDRILSVFSYEFGRITVIAKGVRKIHSRRGFHLDVLNHVDMQIEECTQKKYLREISTVQNFSELKSKPLSFAAACVISSFITRAIPLETPQKILFTLTQTTFEKLNTADNPRQILITYFLKTAKLLGYIRNTIAKNRIRQTLNHALNTIDPQLTLNARKTLGIFSILEST